MHYNHAFGLFASVQVNAAKVVATGSGGRAKDGSLIPMTVKEGDMVLLPEYGGTEVKIEDKEYVFLNFLSSFACFGFLFFTVLILYFLYFLIVLQAPHLPQ